MCNRGLKALKGRVIAEIIPSEHTRDSGIVIIDRKGISCRATVLAVGKDWTDSKGKTHTTTIKAGDIIHFKKYAVTIHGGDKEGLKRGKVTAFWDDVVAVE